MFSKIEILFIIIFLLLTFYLVIAIGARSKGKSAQSKQILNYLFNVRLLIIIVAIVSLILWLLL